MERSMNGYCIRTAQKLPESSAEYKFKYGIESYNN